MSQWKASGLTDTAVVVRETEKEAEILLSALISAVPELRLMETGNCSGISLFQISLFSLNGTNKNKIMTGIIESHVK